MTTKDSILKTLAAAALGVAGVLTLMNVASAQEATTTDPAVEAPADVPATDSADDDENCPEKDGSGGASGSDSTDGSGASGANVGFRRL
ncbi:MAG: hypothetical protein ACRDZ7_14255 [Acidimicrobiia bacterium]